MFAGISYLCLNELICMPVCVHEGFSGCVCVYIGVSVYVYLCVCGWRRLHTSMLVLAWQRRLSSTFCAVVVVLVVVGISWAKARVSCSFWDFGSSLGGLRLSVGICELLFGVRVETFTVDCSNT